MGERTKDQPSGGAARRRRRRRSPYPGWFYLPSGVMYVVLFAVPTFVAFYFSLTRWTAFTSEFIGFGNYQLFVSQPQLVTSFVNTFVYAFSVTALKVVLGLAIGVFLTSQIVARGYLRSVLFFPVLVSTVGVGITFKVLMEPYDGLINQALAVIGVQGPAWLTDPDWALYSVILVDVWKGVGIATLIFIAGLVSIPTEYYEAARVDGASRWQVFRSITLPLVQPATATVVLLSTIGGLRSFELIWAMTEGGPGFTSDVIGSVIYKLYQSGFWGLSTAGNVILFAVVVLVVLPINHFLNKRRVDL